MVPRETKQKLSKIHGLITYWELREATTLLELAIWKSNINNDVERTEDVAERDEVYEEDLPMDAVESVSRRRDTDAKMVDAKMVVRSTGQATICQATPVRAKESVKNAEIVEVGVVDKPKPAPILGAKGTRPQTDGDDTSLIPFWRTRHHDGLLAWDS